MPTAEAMTPQCVCEDCINDDLDADLLSVERLKAQGFWCVIEDGCPRWGTA